MNYYYKSDGKKIDCTRKLKLGYGYFLLGYHDINDTGLLYIMICDNGGTYLTPVFDAEDKMICRPEYAGKDVRETNFKVK